MPYVAGLTTSRPSQFVLIALPTLLSTVPSGLRLMAVQRNAMLI